MQLCLIANEGKQIHYRSNNNVVSQIEFAFLVPNLDGKLLKPCFSHKRNSLTTLFHIDHVNSFRMLNLEERRVSAESYLAIFGSHIRIQDKIQEVSLFTLATQRVRKQSLIPPVIYSL